ncbi:hypothetical protein MKW98_030402 [Papaver atlanticum]|uniref:Uncharacterized protein n=1 Tax=Papaver atlanticum TaxID=357466 RepID=A0AAD4SR26_9MAGN|nr:hypothetical protein MKW98_030402 [Papaver atlanticum]
MVELLIHKRSISSRLIDVPRARELTESDTDKEHELNERRCAAYRVRIGAANRQPGDHEASSSVPISSSAGDHRAQSSFIPRRSPRIELQHRELQLEMLRVAKRDRRSSMSENQKQEILEKWRKAYAMRRIRVGAATNNEHRAGPSNASVQVSNSTGEHKAESSSLIPRRILRIEIQQRGLQLEKLQIAKWETRSSMTEIEKEAHLQRRRNAYYHMKKTRGGDNTSCNSTLKLMQQRSFHDEAREFHRKLSVKKWISRKK